jgi:hypothetical protein
MGKAIVGVVLAWQIGAVKGAQIPSRRKAVLVNHAAKSIATLDSSTAPIGMSCTARVRWRQS